MGHVGLIPHQVHTMGGFKTQGRIADAALKIVDNARAIEEAGGIGLEIEAVPREVGKAVDEVSAARSQVRYADQETHKSSRSAEFVVWRACGTLRVSHRQMIGTHL